jgi:pseudaminic acid synthase
MTKPIIINEREIGECHPPYIIAELSGNHNGSIKNAIKLIEIAKDCGVDAIKLQTYTPDTMTIDCDKEEFRIEDGLWAGYTLYELYEKAHTPWDWHKELFDKAKELNLTIFSTPFDSSSVDFLEELNTPAYKIASFEINDFNLLKRVAETKKPIILSTGMANLIEISEALTVLREGGATDICMLHCVSGYPTKYDELNLKTITDIRERFGLVVGLSDHTLEQIAPISAVAIGASVIEKHFTLSRDNNGPDDAFSIEPSELKDLVNNVNKTWKSLGKVNYKLKDSEKENIKFRRSLYVVKDISKGEVFTDKNIRAIRPGMGASPKYYSDLIGKKSNRDMPRGTPIKLEDIDS